MDEGAATFQGVIPSHAGISILIRMVRRRTSSEATGQLKQMKADSLAAAVIAGNRAKKEGFADRQEQHSSRHRSGKADQDQEAALMDFMLGLHPGHWFLLAGGVFFAFAARRTRREAEEIRRRNRAFHDGARD